VERQGLRLSLTHVAEGEWRATFMGHPMFAPAGFGVAATPWAAVQRGDVDSFEHDGRVMVPWYGK